MPEPQRIAIRLKVNGKEYSATVEPRLLLVELLRDEFDLTGTHIGCDTTYCGACTVLFNDVTVKSCTMFAIQADGAEIATVEGLAGNGDLHPLQQAFVDDHGLQCGYCTPGMLMSGAYLLSRNQQPGEQDIRKGIAGNTCRCTGYQNIFKAVADAAAAVRARKHGD